MLKKNCHQVLGSQKSELTPLELVYQTAGAINPPPHPYKDRVKNERKVRMLGVGAKIGLFSVHRRTLADTRCMDAWSNVLHATERLECEHQVYCTQIYIELTLMKVRNLSHM